MRLLIGRSRHRNPKEEDTESEKWQSPDKAAMKRERPMRRPHISTQACLGAPVLLFLLFLLGVNTRARLLSPLFNLSVPTSIKWG